MNDYLEDCEVDPNIWQKSIGNRNFKPYDRDLKNLGYKYKYLA